MSTIMPIPRVIREHRMFFRVEDDLRKWSEERAGGRRISVAQYLRDLIIEDMRRNGREPTLPTARRRRR